MLLKKLKAFRQNSQFSITSNFGQLKHLHILVFDTDREKKNSRYLKILST